MEIQFKLKQYELDVEFDAEVDEYDLRNCGNDEKRRKRVLEAACRSALQDLEVEIVTTTKEIVAELSYFFGDEEEPCRKM